eukprot:3409710-Pleurochrysis_carterae.AAC.1
MAELRLPADFEEDKKHVISHFVVTRFRDEFSSAALTIDPASFDFSPHFHNLLYYAAHSKL